jgi:hypothetical protein
MIVLCLQDSDWYCVKHGAKIIQAAILPIGQLSEEA